MTSVHPSPEDRNRPEPATTPGLQPGGGVDPGDTPPSEGSMSGTAPDEYDAPNKGPVSGNRTPMIIGLGAVALIALCMIGVILASVIGR